MADVTLERPLPNNLDAERSVLGAILLDNEAFHSAIEGLGVPDFFLRAHRLSFSCMIRLAEQNRAIDLITLNEELERAGDLEAAGGSAYLASLVDGVPRISNVVHYACIVREKAALRNQICTLNHFVNLAFRRDADPERLARQATEKLVEVAPGAFDISRARYAEPPAWPAPLAPEAFYGWAGDIVEVTQPHSEADPVAILVQSLVAFGNIIGRGPHFLAESDFHATNLSAVLVGCTSKGRKGSSWGQVRNIFEPVDPLWLADRVHGGLSSGEGVIWAVRDSIEERKPIKKNGKIVDYKMEVVDPGVDDKRLLALEPEFCAPLRIMRREGNILSAVLRQAWDTGSLRLLTKNSPAKATHAHISIIGHVTKEELLRHLDSTEAASGFANRFLWLCVRRSKVLPDGGKLRREQLQPLIRRLTDAIEFARTVGELRRDEHARKVWHRVYPTLSEGKPGLLGAVIARAEAQVMRLAMIYALLDKSNVIRREHLLAALALWEYAESSARFIFGDSLGNPLADELLRILREKPNGLTRTEVSARFARHQKSGVLDRAFSVLLAAGLARRAKEKTSGRSIEWWLPVLPGCEKRGESEKSS